MKSINIYYIIIFWGCCFFILMHKVVEPDMCWHIKNGEILLQHGVSDLDRMSYWNGVYISHEWLFDIIIYLVYDASGFAGVKCFGVIFMLLGLGVMFATMKEKHDINSFVLAVFIILLFVSGRTFFEPRPQVITFFLTALFFYVMETKRKWYYLPIITLFIVNIHGGTTIQFFLILFVYVVAHVMEVLIEKKKLDTQYLLHLGLAIAAMICVIFINPYGVETVLYPIKTMSGISQEYISEWHPTIQSVKNAPLAVLIMTPIACMSLSSRRNIKDTLFVCFGIVFCLVYVRMYTLCITTSLIFGYQYVQEIIEKVFTWNSNPKFRRFEAVLTLGMSISLFFIVSQIDMDSYGYNSPDIYPKNIVDYIENNNIDINNYIMLNDYNFGGYINLRGHKVFIDGRTDAYLPEFGNNDIFGDYMKFLGILETSDILEKYDVKYIALYKGHKVVEYLLKQDEIKTLYEDDYTILFERVALFSISGGLG